MPWLGYRETTMCNENKILDEFMDNLENLIADTSGSTEYDEYTHPKDVAIQVATLIFEFFSSHHEEIDQVLKIAPKFLEQRNL